MTTANTGESSGDGRAFGNDSAAAAQRQAEWEQALARDTLPRFVKSRLSEAGAGRLPWTSTMTPAELLQSRHLGIRPLAMVSGTIWYHYGWSWTNGHPEGWHSALERMKQEAVAAGANAVVDVRMRTLDLRAEDSMDFTVVGTAVKVDGLPPSANPVLATVSATEFVRLLKEGIVPTGIAIGANYDWLRGYSNNITLGSGWWNQELPELGGFWQVVRRRAVRRLHEDVRRLGNGVLAHTNFEQLFKVERDRQPPDFLGRFIILGTAVQCKRRAELASPIGMVIDMCDGPSPLNDTAPRGHNAYPVDNDQEGAI
jgi:uncharacterized protein YbjQ (UPF0145 family)